MSSTGAKGVMLETLNNPPNLTAGALHQLPHIASRDRVGAWPWRWLPLDGSALSGGYPSGRVGFYSTVAGTKVHLLRAWDGPALKALNAARLGGREPGC